MTKRVLLVAAATLLLFAPAAGAARRDVPRGFYGVTYDRAVAGLPDADQEAQWSLMARSGVESARVVFSWAAAQPEAGSEPSFAGTDLIVARAARHNVRLLPVVVGTPGWAARDPGVNGSPPAHASDYAVFLRALVQRYGSHGSFWGEHPELPRRPVRAWQIWNEPHLLTWWNTAGRPAGSWAPEYAQLLKLAYPAIKGVDPRATVVLTALADFAWDHLDRLNRFGIRRYFDVAALNLFTARPKLVLKGVRFVRRALRRGHEARKPVWVTETTWPAGKSRVPVPRVAWQRAWYTTDRGMAGRVRSLYSIAARERRKLRLGRVYWYTWASEYSDSDLFGYSGLLRYSGGTLAAQPALRAYTRSARRHQGCAKTPAGGCAR